MSDVANEEHLAEPTTEPPAEQPAEQPEVEPDELEDDGPDEVEGAPIDGDPQDPEGVLVTPAQPQGLSEKEMEQAFKKLESENARHWKRIGEIMGEDERANLVKCELCYPLTDGYRFPIVPDDQRAAVMLAVGMSETANRKQDTRTQACDDCAGWGMVATGSKVPGQDALPCMTCGGRGWTGERTPSSATVDFAPNAANVENGAPAVVPRSPEADAAKRAAEAAGFIVIDTHAPAPA